MGMGMGRRMGRRMGRSMGSGGHSTGTGTGTGTGSGMGHMGGGHGTVCTPSPNPPNPPAPNSTNVYMPDCSLAAPGWPTFNTADDLQADSDWAHYFNTVYGGIPSSGYPICVGSFTTIAVRGASDKIVENVQHCDDTTVDDGTLVYAMTPWIEPSQNSVQDVVTHIYSLKNVKHAVPSNMWVEVQHLHSRGDRGEAWYFLEFGSAVWFNVGNTIVFEDHPDASKYFLSAECNERHPDSPHTECESDFVDWYVEARKQKYESIQFTSHYDCGCGEEGPSSWTHNRLCHTEIIDFNAPCNDNGCGSDNYKAGWAAQHDCDCDTSKEYSNCKGFGA